MKASHHQKLNKFYSILRWMVHPVVVFVTLQIIWLAITLMWVFWFLESFQEIAKIAEIVGSSYLDNQYALIILIVGCILLGMLLVGTVMLFVTSQKQSHLMSQHKSFLSSVTHELRSPLASLQLTFETMKTRQIDGDTRNKMLEMAMEDIERLTRLVDQILVSSRLDRGLRGFSEEAEHLCLGEFIKTTALRAQWLDPDIEKRLEIICPQELEIHVPIPVMRLIISNLVENAIKYSPKGNPIKILVTLKEGMITIAVKDDGFGLSSADKKRIFRMFHRASITQKKAIPGTGLGLFIVKSLAKTLGGHAWAESPGKDKGSTFYLSFPVT